jgi:uncharacterized repeat protein (TIGR03803 family)
MKNCGQHTSAAVERGMREVSLVVGALAALMTLGTAAAQAPSAGSYRLLYSFQCSPDGATPEAELVRDPAGNLYGTTVSGGQIGYGTVFKVTPGGREVVLHSFAGPSSDGANPYFAPLTLDADGNVYGTTPNGGASGQGVVFKITAGGTETVLYSFTGGTDGASPRSGVIRDSSGNLYGTTYDGGEFGDGVVFEVSSAGVETVLHSFESTSTDGSHPDGGLVRDSAGNLYGTTAYGGPSGNGLVFEAPPDGPELVLHSFAGYPSDGALPFGTSLLRDPAGDLYGTTYFGGTTGNGVVFKVTAAGSETVLLNFNGGSGGGNPYDGLAEDASGNLYGTTENGGSAQCGYQGCGVLFKLSPTGKDGILHNFDLSTTDGAYSYGGAVRDPEGNLYGTLSAGGPSSCGAVFKYTP